MLIITTICTGADNSTGGITRVVLYTHGGYVYCADGYDNSGNYNASNFTTLRGRFLDPFYGMSSINTKYTKEHRPTTQTKPKS